MQRSAEPAAIRLAEQRQAQRKPEIVQQTTIIF